MKTHTTTALALFVLLLARLPASEFGEFVGPLQAEWLDDGRKMKILADFKYIGPDNTVWVAPNASVIDGASIPQTFWSIIGGPFEGLYRNASVIHDVGCEEKTRPWPTVHWAFYTGMRAGGVGPIKSQLMYAAVYYFGPRWPMKVQMRKQGAEANTELESLAQQVPAGSEIVTVVKTRPFQLFERTATLDDPNLSAIVFPPQNEITPEQFAELRQKIEASEGRLPVAEIHAFGALKNTGLKTRILRETSTVQPDRIKDYLKVKKFDAVKFKATDLQR